MLLILSISKKYQWRNSYDKIYAYWHEFYMISLDVSNLLNLNRMTYSRIFGHI